MINKTLKNVQILDCTLRDGGRIIDCCFEDSIIKDISINLAKAKIDIIEIGFLRDKKKSNYTGNSTFFTNLEQIIPFVDKKYKETEYVVFIDYGMYDFDSLTSYDTKSIDGIRVGFTKEDFDNSINDVIKCLNIVKEKGYKLYIQGINSLSYSDNELLKLITLVNHIKPYSFGIVDTYGAMYISDVTRLYNLINKNMDPDICIDLHSHNNFQLSFAFAQEIIKLSFGKRKIIIDCTLNGMGKCAGNLCTELLVDFLVRKCNYDYNFDIILDIIDKYIYYYKSSNNWGYSISAVMAGIYKSHPNNIIYLIENLKLNEKDIKNLLEIIDEKTRQTYNYNNIRKLYIEYSNKNANDNKIT